MKTFSVQSIVKPYRKPERYETVSFRIDEEGMLWYLDKYRPPEKAEKLQMVNRKRLVSDQWDRRVKMVLSEKTIWVTKHRAEFFGMIPKGKRAAKAKTPVNKVDRPEQQTIPLTMDMSRYLVIKRKAEKEGLSIAQYIKNRLPTQ